MSPKKPLDEQEEPPKLLTKSKPAINAYLKYSGMGIQMAFVITIFSLLGVKLDAWLGLEPLFTVILSLGGVALSMYVFIRQLLVENKSEQEEAEE